MIIHEPLDTSGVSTIYTNRQLILKQIRNIGFGSATYEDLYPLTSLGNVEKLLQESKTLCLVHNCGPHQESMTTHTTVLTE